MLEAHLKNKIDSYTNHLKQKQNKLKILIAFSGGIDSVVLASVLIKLQHHMNYEIAFAHINHNLQQDSKIFETFSRKYAEKHKCQFYLHSLDSNNIEGSVEEWGRKERYSFFNKITSKYNFDMIFTAHHQDDQIETIFMRKLKKGDWITQIGIRENIGKIYRPLIEIPKSEIIKYAKLNSLEWVEDKSNVDTKFLRNLIRHELLPKALINNSKLYEDLLLTAKTNFFNYNKIVDKIARVENQILHESNVDYLVLNSKPISKLIFDEKKVLFQIQINNILGFTPKQSEGNWLNLFNFIKIAKTGNIYNIGNMLSILKDRDMLYLFKNSEINKCTIRINYDTDLFWYNSKFTVSKCDNNEIMSTNKQFVVLDKEHINNGLIIRNWNYGDRIQSYNNGKSVKLSDLFVDNKLSYFDKQRQPVMTDNKNNILWVPRLIHSKIIDININENKKIKISFNK
jgi:tRNA(Ile)-lysidine synthase